MNLQTLIAELQKPAYAGKTAAEAYAILTAQSQATYTAISVEQFRLWMVGINGLPTLTNVANENPAKSLAALFVLKFNQGEELNLGDADVRQSLDTLVENNVLTANQKKSLLDEGTTTTSIAQQLGLSGLTAQDVHDALHQISLLQGE